MRRGARDPDADVDAVEVDRSGRSGSFDGNHTSDLDSWFVAPVGTQVEDARLELRELMKLTMLGHLSWCVFPVDTD